MAKMVVKILESDDESPIQYFWKNVGYIKSKYEINLVQNQVKQLSFSKLWQKC